MKAKKQGFTLIELLTVIAIIGILAGIIIPSVGAVRNSAKKAKTQAMFSQWASAIELFRQDYGYYPTFGGSGSISLSSNKAKFVGLLEGTDDEFNTKGIRYYSFPTDAFVDDQGNPTGDPDDNLVDSFGNDNIYMVVDSDRNGVIPESDIGALADSDVRSGVVFYSDKGGNNDFEDIKSWE